MEHKVGEQTHETALDGLSGRLLKWTVVLLAAILLVDVVMAVDAASLVAWSMLAVSVTVSVLAVRGLAAGGVPLFRAAGPAVALSLAGTLAALVVTLTGRWGAMFGLSEGTSLTLLVIACWRRRTGPRQTLVGVGLLIAVSSLPLRLGISVDIATIELAALFVSAVAVAVGEALRASDAQRFSAVAAVRRVEREDVARELHDVVAHHVTGMVVLTQAARTLTTHGSSGTTPFTGAPKPTSTAMPTDIDNADQRSDRGPVPDLDGALAAVEEAGAEALASLRSMVAVLRRSDLDPADSGPLTPFASLDHLQEVIRRFDESGATEHVDFSLGPGVREVTPHVAAAVLRVVQESLTNVARYARGAEWVRVDVICAAGSAVVTVSDTGGREAPPGGTENAKRWGGGFGLVGMRERASTLGGTFSAGPVPGRAGWTVRVELPA